MNFLESFIVNAALGIILGVVKNPAHKAQLASHLIPLRDALNTAFPPAVG